MSPLTKTLPLGLVLGLLALAMIHPLAPAQQPAAGGPPPIAGAQFRSVPQPAPYVPTSVYAPQYNGPVGGYLSGAADVIDAQGGYLVNNQQALQMREQVLQSRQDTRRKTMDEWLYERSVTPTLTDENERYRLEMLRTTRNEAQLSEIWSGKAMNRILDQLKRQQAQQVQGPNVPVEANILKHLNVTGGRAEGGLGLLKNGQLRWPEPLDTPTFEENRKKMDKLMSQATNELGAGGVENETLRDLKKYSNRLTIDLREHVGEMDINDYTAAKSYLRELDNTVIALKDPNIGGYALEIPLSGSSTVAAVTAQMSSKGLRYAPATTPDQPAYSAMYNAMVAYLVYPPKKWDPLAK
jgi:hypothetical protein